MWSQAVLVCTVILLVKGENFDVTTIYDVGDICQPEQDQTDSQISMFHRQMPSCVTDIKGWIHARSNALGLPLDDGKENYIVPSNSQLSHITCNTEYTCSWDIKDWDLSVAYDCSDCRNVIKNEKTYKFSEHLTLKFNVTAFRSEPRNRIFLYFTNGVTNINNQKTYFVIPFFGESYHYVYSKCFIHEEAQFTVKRYNYKLNDKRGKTIFYCESQLTSFTFYYDRDEYFSFSFVGEKIRIFQGINDQSLVVDNSVQDSVDVKYFSIFGVKNYEFLRLIRVLSAKDEGSEMISPIINLDSKQLCLVLVIHAEQTTTGDLLHIMAEDLLDVQHLLQTINNVHSGWNIKHVNLTLDSNILSPGKLVIKKTGSQKVKISWISACNTDGEEVEVLPASPVDSYEMQRLKYSPILPVYRVSSNILKSELNSSSQIYHFENECLNNGNWVSGECVCPPGFSGSSCEIGCGRNRYGQDCGGVCSLRIKECQGLLMCTSLTGCQCAPGYSGDDCKQQCLSGLYGNDCSQKCGQCVSNSSCDIYTGKCAYCEPGYVPPYCKEVYSYYSSEPELSSSDYGKITVKYYTNIYHSGYGTPALYQIQYRKKGGHWYTYVTKQVPDFTDQVPDVPEEHIEDHAVIEDIEGLEIGTVYEVRVLFMTSNFNKYDGNLVQISNIITKCDIPEEYDYKVKTVSDTNSFTFMWSYINRSIHWCPVENYEVSWKEDWEWKSEFTQEENFRITGFLPGSKIKFRVRAKTSTGYAPYSKTALVSTKYNNSLSVNNLHVKSSQSTSADIIWDAPRDNDGRNLRYTVAYKCLEQPACSPGCYNATEGEFTQEKTSATLSPLLPFSRYLVKVTPENGIMAGLYVGTSQITPTEIPILSTQKPVRTNTSLTVFWDEVSVCSSFFQGYKYQLAKETDQLKVLASGLTRKTSVSFHNLTASTVYVVKVFISTVAGWNPQAFLAIKTSTSATVPEAVQNLTIYKRGRNMLGLRWAEPQAMYGALKSFTITHVLGKEIKSHTIEPTRCVAWPELYCHTIDNLKANRRYNVTVNARNADVAEDGEGATVSGVTKENPPTAPESLKLINSSSTSVALEWRHPDLANGLLRSFLVSVEETEKFDQDNCCQVYPLVEAPVKEELQTYNAEVSGLHPASTYFVSVSAKTVGLGPSQSLVVYTRPPHLPLTVLPVLEVTSAEEISWLPQEQLPEVNNSEIYTPLIKARLLLAIDNETESVLEANNNGILDPQLSSLLRNKIFKPFFFVSEYNEELIIIDSNPQESDSVWGQSPLPYPLITGHLYQLIIAQVTEYSGVYNVDLRYSTVFTLLL